MPSINYRLWFDKAQWFYIADVDPKGLSKKQVKELQNLTEIVQKYVTLLNLLEILETKGLLEKSAKKRGGNVEERTP